MANLFGVVLSDPTPFPSVSPIDWAEVHEQQIRDEGWLSLIVIVGVVLLIVLQCAACWYIDFRNNGSRSGAARTSRLPQPESKAAPSSRRNDQASPVSEIADKNVVELTVLFSETIEKNKRQTRLKTFQILEGNPMDDDDEDDDDEEIQRANNTQIAPAADQRSFGWRFLSF